MQPVTGRINRAVWAGITAAAMLIAAGVVLTRSAAIAAPAEGAREARELFNGRDLSGWDGDGIHWSVEDGAITGRTSAEHPLKVNTFLIWKDGTVGDFDLHVSYKIVGGNSGVQYRSRRRDELGDHVVSGYQADIVDSDPDKFSGILYEERGRGILAERGQKVVIDEAGKKQVTGSLGEAQELAKAVKNHEWNDYEIIARGNHLVHKINGVTTVDVTDSQKDKSAREGILALQIHAGPFMTVQFKDIRLQVLKGE
jgi:hypothetical protein